MEEIPETAVFLEQFTIFRNERLSVNGISKQGGVLIALKRTIRYTKVENNYPDTISKLFELGKKYLHCCMYSAPKNNQDRLDTTTISAINASTELAQIKGCDAVYIVGDINFDNTNWNQMTSTDDSECIILDKLFENNYQQLIHKRQKSTDVFITNITNTKTVLTLTVDNKLKGLHRSNHPPDQVKLQTLI